MSTPVTESVKQLPSPTSSLNFNPPSDLVTFFEVYFKLEIACVLKWKYVVLTQWELGSMSWVGWGWGVWGYSLFNFNRNCLNHTKRRCKEKSATLNPTTKTRLCFQRAVVVPRVMRSTWPLFTCSRHTATTSKPSSRTDPKLAGEQGH